MSTIYSLLNVNAADHVMLNTMGQSVVYDAVQEVLRIHEQELTQAVSVFVDETTTDHKRRFKLPGNGMMQRRGGQAQSAAIAASGEWDVAFPLESFGDQIAVDREEFAYMTVQDLARHIDSITNRNVNTMRFEILYALLNNTQKAFADKRWGSLSVEPLANGDSVVYPPVLGSSSEATANHYIETNYASSSISNSNDPIATIVSTLESRFGAVTGGSNIVVFHNNAETAKLEALTAYEEIPDRYIQLGDDTARPNSVLSNVPGRVIGRHTGGAWLSEWRWVPANYLIGVHLDADRPLIKRVHPSNTGLGMGLQLVAENDRYPFTQSHYEHDYGFGVGNRLNGVVLELGTGGSYTVPTAYA